MTVTVRKYVLKDGKRQAPYLDIYHRGVRRRESLNLYLTGKRDEDRECMKLAELIAAKRRLNLAEDENAIKTTRRRGGDFLAYAMKIADAKRVNDAGVWRRALAHFAAYAGPRVPFDRLTPSVLEAFKGYLLEKLKPGSAWTYWRKVVSACRRAMKDGIILRHPAADIPFPRPEAEREFLTLQELRWLAVTPCSTPEVRESFIFACYCGLRWSDLKALTWDQVRESEAGFEIVLTQKKTLEPVRIPLPATAAELVKDRAPRNGAVFALPPQQTYDKAVKRWAKAAGVGKTISIHVARHTFATSLLNQGVDLYSVSRLLGHRALETTKGYVHLLDASKRAAVEKLPAIKLAK